MSESAEWLAEHKGRYVRTVGYIWTCDDECGCEQAVVVDYFENKVVRGRVPVNVWAGTFTTGEDRYEADIPRPDAELAAYRRALRESDPEREAAIEWQKGIDYDAAASPSRPVADNRQETP